MSVFFFVSSAFAESTIYAQIFFFYVINLDVDVDLNRVLDSKVLIKYIIHSHKTHVDGKDHDGYRQNNPREVYHYKTLNALFARHRTTANCVFAHTIRSVLQILRIRVYCCIYNFFGFCYFCYESFVFYAVIADGRVKGMGLN